MAKEVDTKVVEMVFDNKDFEKGVKETKQSINGLKESITDLSNSADGTQSVEKVNKVVIDKMSVLASAVNTAVTRITNDVFDGIAKINNKVSQLTIAPISSGFSKYEEQIESVQTIMNATGKSIDQVTEQLDKLMWYTDETSYSYTDMAANIGKFTSAGVELEDAVTAMMGIANWAGVSGANVQQASRAMYNLSQAMGTGALKLQDWMSIENANMATKEFKQNLIETAIELGVLDKETTITAENMRESLKDSWVTRDVLTQTLAKYGNYTEDLYKLNQEGIDTVSDAMEEYENRFSGIVDELTDAYEKYGKASTEFQAIVKKNKISTQTAMDLVTKRQAERFNANIDKIYKKLKETADAYGFESQQFAKATKDFGLEINEAVAIVNEGIENFKKAEVSLGEKSFKAAQEAKTFKDAWNATIDAVSSQWLRFWNAIFGNYVDAKVMWTQLANTMWEVFAGPIEKLADIAEMVVDVGGRDNVLDGITNAWNAFCVVIDNIKEVLQEIYPFLKGDEFSAGFLYALTERFREWTLTLEPASESLEKLKITLKSVLIILKSVVEILVNVGWNLLRIVDAILPSKELIIGALESIFGEAANIETVTENITNSVTFVTNIIIIAINIIKKVLAVGFSFILYLVRNLITSITNAFQNIEENKILTALVGILGIAANVLLYAGQQILSVLVILYDGISSFVNGIFQFLQQFADAEDKWAVMKQWF